MAERTFDDFLDGKTDEAPGARASVAAPSPYDDFLDGKTDDPYGAFLDGKTDDPYTAPPAESFAQQVADYFLPDVPDLLRKNKDLAVSFAQGSNALMGLGGTLYGLASGNMDNWLKQQAERGQEYWKERKSPQLKAEEEARRQAVDATKGEIDKLGVALWTTVSSPTLLTSFLAEQAPNLVGGAVPGALAKAGAKALGAGAFGQGVAGTAGILVGSAGLEGADAAGQAYEQLKRLPTPMWEASPRVQKEMATNGGDLEAAIETVAQDLAGNAGIAQAVLAVATNMIPGAMLAEKALAGVKVPGRSKLLNAAAGLVGETLQEGAQEGSSQLVANVATSEIDPNQKLSENVGEAVGLGMAAGPLGLIAGAGPTEKTSKKTADLAGKANEILSAGSMDEAIAKAEGQLAEIAGARKAKAGEEPLAARFEELLGPEATVEAEDLDALTDLASDVPVDEGAEETFEYSSSQVRLPEESAAAVRQAAQQLIDPADLNEAEGGFEDQPHITIKYGLDPSDQEAVAKVLQAAGPVEVTVGGIEVFQPEGKDYDVIVQRVESEQLRGLRQEIEAVVEGEGDSFPVYKPHMTLAYVNRGEGEKYAESVTGLEGQKLLFENGEFTDLDGTPIKVPFLGTVSRETTTTGPAVEPATPEVEYFDPRLKREDFRADLEQRKREIVKGGGIAYITNPKNEAEIIGRTASSNPPWFQSLAADEGITVEQLQVAIDKALTGKRLGQRQERAVRGLLDLRQVERIEGENPTQGVLTPLEDARARLAESREKRRIERVTGPTPPPAVHAELASFYEVLGETFEDASYLPEMEFEARALVDMAAQLDAKGGDADALLANATDVESAIDSFEAALEKAYGPATTAEEKALAAGAGQEAAPDEQVQQDEAEGQGDSQAAVTRPAAQSTDLFGPSPTAAQALLDEQRKRDAARNTGSDDMTGTLFGGDRGQTDLMDVEGVDTRKQPDSAISSPSNEGAKAEPLTPEQLRKQMTSIDPEHADQIRQAVLDLEVRARGPVPEGRISKKGTPLKTLGPPFEGRAERHEGKKKKGQRKTNPEMTFVFGDWEVTVANPERDEADALSRAQRIFDREVSLQHPNNLLRAQRGQWAMENDAKRREAEAAETGLVEGEDLPAEEAAQPVDQGDDNLVIVRHTFASGLNRAVDMKGAIDKGLPFGVDVGLLSSENLARVAVAAADGVDVFVDSGAFRIYRENLKRGNKQLAIEAFGEGGKALPVKDVIQSYVKLMQQAEAEGGIEALRRLHLVMPDVVGNADATMKLIEEWRDSIIDFMDSGIDVIIPIQSGMDMAALRELFQAANTGFRVGIPSNAAALSIEEFRSIVEGGATGIHFLGAASEAKAREKLDAIREIAAATGFEYNITMDANVVRSRLDGLAGLSGDARSEEIGNILLDLAAGTQQIPARDFGENDPRTRVEREYEAKLERFRRQGLDPSRALELAQAWREAAYAGLMDREGAIKPDLNFYTSDEDAVRGKQGETGYQWGYDLGQVDTAPPVQVERSRRSRTYPDLFSQDAAAREASMKAQELQATATRAGGPKGKKAENAAYVSDLVSLVRSIDEANLESLDPENMEQADKDRVKTLKDQVGAFSKTRIRHPKMKFRPGTSYADWSMALVAWRNRMVESLQPVAAETKAPKAETKDASGETLEDFGEKIGGARKDVWTKAMSEELPAEAKDIKLATHFPMPDFAKLIEEGADPKAMAMVKAMRDEIPAKPQKGWKLKRWGEQVRMLRQFAMEIIAGDISVDLIEARIRGEFPALKPILDRARLYQDVGFPAVTDLRGYELRLSHYAIFMGQKNVDKWTLRPKSAGRTFGGMGGEMHFDSREEAVARLKEILSKPVELKTRLDIYSKRGEKGVIYIGKKVAAGKFIQLHRLEGGVSEARAYLRENEDALLEKLEQRKNTPNMRRELNEIRVGRDYRNGQNVTPEQFGEAFGFRGVEFGNWVEGSRRQADLNNAYDGLLDLADLLQIPSQALSLNGELGLAFGARGTGGTNAAKAHYEPDRVVINLTKKEGAGSLAHEWWHALDNYLAKQNAIAKGYLSEAPKPRINRDGTIQEGVRPEVLVAWQNLVKTINATGLVKRSKVLDKRRTNDYWSTIIELSARSFERFVIDKAADRDDANDYLANIVPQDLWDAMDALTGETEASYPYPTDEEAVKINAAYQNIFNTLEHKVTDGGTALFALEQSPMGFYSGLAKAASNLKQEKGSAKQMLQALKKMPGVKAEELDWTGLEEWMDALNRPVTKAEIQEFLDQNGVEVEEILLLPEGDLPPIADDVFLDEPRAVEPSSEWLRDETKFILEEWINKEDFTDEEGEFDHIKATFFAEDLALQQWNDDPLEIGEIILFSNEDGIATPLTLRGYRSNLAAWNLFDGETRIAEVDITNGLDAAMETVVKAALERGLISDVEDIEEVQYDRPTLRSPGGTNYRERLFTLKAVPPKFDPARARVDRYEETNADSETGDVDYTLDNGTIRVIYRAGPDMAARMTDEQLIAHVQGLYEKGKLGNVLINGRDRRNPAYDAPHFGDVGVRNILAHVRTTDTVGPNGERLLNLEEVQSDWHQAGRDFGYVNQAEKEKEMELKAELKAELQRVEQEMERLHPDAVDILERLDYLGFERLGQAIGAVLGHEDFAWRWEIDDPAEAKLLTEYRIARNRVKELEKELEFAVAKGFSGIPDAPFKGNAWVELVLKRAIRLAAEEGYDGITWTTGAEQADRYDLGQVVDRIDVSRALPGQDEKLLRLALYSEGDQEPHSLYVEPDGLIIQSSVPWFEDRALADVIGARLAEKVMAVQESGTVATFAGDDLRIGGEGMRGFYDRTLPNVFNKVARKLDKRAGVETFADYSTDKYRIVNRGGRGGGAWRIIDMTTSGGEYVGHEYTSEEQAMEAAKTLVANQGGAQRGLLRITPKIRQIAVSEGQTLFASSTMERVKEPIPRIGPAYRGMTPGAVQEALQPMYDAIHESWGLEVRIVHSNELPSKPPPGYRIFGMMKGRDVWIAYDQLENARDAQRILAHEVIGHVGVDAMMGDQWPVAMKHYEAMKARGGRQFQSVYDKMWRRYSRRIEERLSIEPELEVMEFIAVAAELRMEEGPVATFMRQIRELFAKALKAMGWSRPFSMTDINLILSASQRHLSQDAGGATRVMGVGEPGPGEQVDLFADVPVPARAKREAAQQIYRTSTVNEQVSTVKVPTDIVKTPEDAAAVISAWGRNAQETMLVLVTDENGKILEVQRHSIGGVNYSSVADAQMIGAALSVEGVRNIWLAHNHPSGFVSQSVADMQVTQFALKHLEGTGVNLKGMMVVGGGAQDYSLYTVGMNQSRPITPTLDLASKKATLSVTERMIDQRAQGKPLSSPVETLDYVKAAGHTSGVLFLTNRNVPAGFVQMTRAEMERLNTGSLKGPKAQLLRAFHTFNANAAIVVIEAQDTTHESLKPALNAMRFLNSFGRNVTVLDVVATGGDGRGLSALSAGHAMNLDGTYQALEQSPEFKAWFGESKVVGRNGEPMVVYHGTQQDFDTFREGSGKFGMHFGSKEQANFFSWVPEGVGNLFSGRNMPVYLSIQNPVRLKDQGDWSPETIVEDLQERGLVSDDAAAQVAAWVKNPSGPIDPYEVIKTDLARQGYDGVVYLNRGEGINAEEGDGFSMSDSDAVIRRKFPEARDSYIAFRPNQIKSAIGNRGTFDPNEDSILYALQDEFEQPEIEAIEHGGMGLQSRGRRFRDRWNEINQQRKARFRQTWIDSYDSIRNILHDERAWMKAQLTAGSWGSLEAGIDYGKLELDPSGVIQVDTTSKSLKEILVPLGPDLDRFLYWIVGNRANRLMGEGRENLFEQKHIDPMMKMNEDKQPGRVGYRPGRKQLFDQVRAEFEAWGDSIVDIAVETGLVDKAEADVWRNEGFYLPFYRVLADEKNAKGPRVMGNTGLVKQHAYKRLKGGLSQLDDPLGNAISNWSHLLGAALKNKAARDTLATAQGMGLAQQVAKKDATKDAIYVRVGGKEQWWELDPSVEGQLVLQSLSALNWEGFNNPVARAARKAKRALTMGVTASPEFKVANLIRDSLQAVAVSTVSPKIWENLQLGFKATKRDSPLHAQMLAGGAIFGESGYIHGADPDAMRYLLKRGVTRNTILDNRNAVKKAWGLWQDFGARLENVNRAANFVQDLAAGGDLLTATFNARDHLDFSRHGAGWVARVLTSTVPFLNARIQGLDKLGRSAMNKEQQARFYTTVAVYGFASVLMYLYMSDDEDYLKAEEWERDTYHLFKVPGSDIMWRLPRPFELGAIANMMERAVEQFTRNDVHGTLFAERLLFTLTHTFSFNPAPQLIFPALEVWANRDTFTDREIEPAYMRGTRSKKNIKRAWTSETAIGLSHGMAAVTGDAVLSPVQIEHLVNGYFGWAGATFLAGFDMIIRNAADVAQPPSRKWFEYPLVKRFAREGVTRNTKYETYFYEHLGEMEKQFGDIRLYKAERDGEGAKALQEKYKDTLRFRRYFNRQAKKLSDINEKMSRIRLSRDLTPEEKGVQIDELLMRKHAITERAVQRVRQAGDS